MERQALGAGRSSGRVAQTRRASPRASWVEKSKAWVNDAWIGAAPPMRRQGRAEAAMFSGTRCHSAPARVSNPNMTHSNPLAEDAPTDAEDVELARLAQSGNKEALESLVTRHQGWIYNIALRMLCHPQDAEDAAQEILVKAITHLSTFRGESQFRTWLYRIATNHLLNVKRAGRRVEPWSFEEYRRELHDIEDADLPDPNAISADVQLYVHEARIGCTTGMLLCLDAEQRLVYVLGAIFGVCDRVGAELLEISRDNFRQKLTRARRDLRSFMEDECGLVKTSNPCRCAKKTQGFIKAGYIDARTLLFARDHVARVAELVGNRSDAIDTIDAAYAEIHRDHPFQPSPDFLASLRGLIQKSDLLSPLKA
jgi:RNA polymerase sigma factor (sigma-70 family)